VELSTSIPIEVPEDVITKIRYLCMQRPRQEWSGPLFYTVEGSIKDAKNMKITLKDILLMDVGSGGATGFDWDEDVVNYQMDNPDAIDWTIGHIHSHNTMGVFFSGTDYEELNDNCAQHNYYLSVIVNNNLDMIAKIAFTAMPKSYVCKAENGEEYGMTIQGNITPKMFVYNCEPKFEIDLPKVSKEFADRLEIVEKKKEAIEEAKKKEKEKSSPSGPAKDWGEHDKYESVRGKGAGNYPLTDKEKAFLNKKDKQVRGTEDKDIEDWFDRPAKDRKPDLFELFAAFLVRMGSDLVEDDIETAIYDLDQAWVNPESVAEYISVNYPALFDEYFKDIPKYKNDMAQNHPDVLEAVLEYIKMYRKVYDDFCEPLIEKLEELLIEYNPVNSK